jgi:hypothetical protein
MEKKGSRSPLQKGADWCLLVGNIFIELLCCIDSRSYRIIYNETEVS